MGKEHGSGKLKYIIWFLSRDSWLQLITQVHAPLFHFSYPAFSFNFFISFLSFSPFPSRSLSVVILLYLLTFFLLLAFDTSLARAFVTCTSLLLGLYQFKRNFTCELELTYTKLCQPTRSELKWYTFIYEEIIWKIATWGLACVWSLALACDKMRRR